MAVLLTNVVDRADIGMVQRRSRLGFTPESFERLWVAGELFRKELQRDKTVEACVLGLVHHTHATAVEFLDDPVVRDGLANQGRHHFPVGTRRFNSSVQFSTTLICVAAVRSCSA